MYLRHSKVSLANKPTKELVSFMKDNGFLFPVCAGTYTFSKSLINLILSFRFLQIGKQCSGIYPAHFCLLGKVSVPLRSVQSRRPPDVLHPNPLELRISRRAKLTLYHKITFSSLNLPHKDTLLPQVFFSETLFVHYASALFLQYPLRTIFRFHLLSLHTD